MPWFLPRLDLFKAIAARLVLDDGGPSLGFTWLRRFPNRYTEHSNKFASGLDRKCALSSKSEPYGTRMYQQAPLKYAKSTFALANVYIAHCRYKIRIFGYF